MVNITFIRALAALPHELAFGIELVPLNSKIISDFILWLLLGHLQMSTLRCAEVVLESQIALKYGQNNLYKIWATLFYKQDFGVELDLLNSK